jgi:histidinol phosphatase-like enzyme
MTLEMDTAIKKILSHLEDDGVSLKELTALDFFAREGDWQTHQVAKKVSKIHAWEIDSKFEKKLRDNLPSNAEIVIGDSFETSKSNKEIFDYAFAKTGATATNSIMIGDNQDADIKGGINAGMDTIFVNHIGATPHVKATHEVFDLPSIAKLL